MKTAKILLCVLLGAAILASCSNEPPASEPFEELEPYDNPFGPDEPLWAPQPQRPKPSAMALSTDRGQLFVALPGSVDRPDRQVAVIDLEQGRVVDRHQVGRAPSALALHPKGEHLVVANRFANHLSIIDLDSGDISEFPVDFYAEGLLFDSAGETLFVANRWKNSVQPFQTRFAKGDLQLQKHPELAGAQGIAVGFNPHRMALSDDESTLYVASPAGLAVAVIDLEQVGRARQLLTTASPVEVEEGDTQPPAHSDWALEVGVDPIWIGAPPFDLVVTDDLLYVATLSESTHHPPGTTGEETHPYGQPSTGSPNQGFQALQNEIALYDRRYLSPVKRYTSSSYCCPDVRDVSPDDPERGHLVPDESLWIVDGALPTAMAHYQPHLLVAYGGSNELQRFDMGADGDLEPGPVITVGFDPRELLVWPERDEAYVLNRLSGSVSVVDLSTFQVAQEISLMPKEEPRFPATDAELGELIFYSGAALSVDGGQTCNHCHFDRGNIGKFFSMPLLADARGSRMTMDTRGLFDGRPWYLEGAMDESNISAELAEFAHLDNFCCDGHDDPAQCSQERPPPCDEPPFDDRPATRDAFFADQFQDLTGHSLTGQPTTFDEATRLLGLYLIHEPALLPNPNDAQSAAARRGRLLFESPTTGCVVCHPAPTFGVSTDVNPFQTPILFGPLIEPLRDGSGKNLNLLSQAFLESFPMAEQRAGDVYLKSPALRGIWDRAPGFYHDGRAPTLREALATPDHPALHSWETGYNVADDVFDSHGGTSHLTNDELEDLIEFLLTL